MLVTPWTKPAGLIDAQTLPPAPPPWQSPFPTCHMVKALTDALLPRDNREKTPISLDTLRSYSEHTLVGNRQERVSAKNDNPYLLSSISPF